MRSRDTIYFKSATIIMLGLALFAALFPSSALKNPAAVYCQSLGYNYRIEMADNGEVGYCLLPNGQSVDAWEFLLGEAGQEFGYCARMGLRQEVVEGYRTCFLFATPSCAACILGNGSKVEVTRLMNLSFNEATCNDGRCGFPEDYRSCPADCPTGGLDGACDGMRDGKCDPDCQGAADPDCPEKVGLPSGEGTRSAIIEPATIEPAAEIISPGNTADLKAIRLVTGEASIDPGGSVARIPVWLRIENAGLASSGAFKLSIDVIEISGRRYTVPFAVQDQENIWYPMVADLAGQSQIDIGGEVTLGQPSGPDLRGQTFTLVAKVDSCSGDEFKPGYCRVEESDESNNEIETNIAL
jgi:putative hemolysin